MEMVASPAMTTPRSRRWSSVSSSVRSTVSSGIGESVRRPRSGQRERDALGVVPARELIAKLLQARFLVAVDENVDLRECSAALQTRFGHGVAGELLHHRGFNLADDLPLRLARGIFLLLIELLTQQIGLARCCLFDFSRQLL